MVSTESGSPPQLDVKTGAARLDAALEWMDALSADGSGRLTSLLGINSPGLCSDETLECAAKEAEARKLGLHYHLAVFSGETEALRARSGGGFGRIPLAIGSVAARYPSGGREYPEGRGDGRPSGLRCATGHCAPRRRRPGDPHTGGRTRAREDPPGPGDERDRPRSLRRHAGLSAHRPPRRRKRNDCPPGRRPPNGHTRRSEGAEALGKCRLHRDRKEGGPHLRDARSRSGPRFWKRRIRQRWSSRSAAQGM